MGLFGNGEAMRLAQRVDEKTNAANVVMSQWIAKFEQHIASCDARGRQLAEDLQRDRATLHEWRKGLGDRLDAQDKLMWSVAMMVIGLLASSVIAIGTYVLSHLVTFK